MEMMKMPKILKVEPTGQGVRPSQILHESYSLFANSQILSFSSQNVVVLITSPSSSSMPITFKRATTSFPPSITRVASSKSGWLMHLLKLKTAAYSSIGIIKPIFEPSSMMDCRMQLWAVLTLPTLANGSSSLPHLLAARDIWSNSTKTPWLS